MTTAERIVELFGMKPLPREGGFYVETYRCPERITRSPRAAGSGDRRNLSTAILYLLTAETFSALHRIGSDETFHFYLGDPVTMLQLRADGSSQVVTLGHDILGGQRVQVVVPANTWQGCFVNPGGRFALMGTTVTPGFEFEDFEQPDAEALLGQYGEHRDLIIRLSRRD